MAILGPEHDFAHPVEGDSAWSESYYFNCYDPAVDAGFFSRIGIRPHEGTMDAAHMVWLPGDELALVRSVREQHVMTDTDLTVGGVSYERLEPMKRWRLTSDGNAAVLNLADPARGRTATVAMDAVFEALTPASGTDGQGRSGTGASAETGASVGKGHLEQAGRWQGWIEVDGRRLQLGSAMGNRDKSWGPRRWGGPTMWRWFSINIDETTHFGGIRIGTAAGDLHRGWAYVDGTLSSIRDWRVQTTLAPDGLTHTRTAVEATDKSGRIHALDAELLRVAKLPHGPGTVLLEGLARWTYQGRTGYGIAEYLHQLDAEGAPVVPIE